MINLTTNKIEEWAPNASAAKNGRDLHSKNKFSNLKIDADKLLIWGECSGSGKNPYYCSADFINESNPVFRCNCPSRQFPCKHSVGLLYAYEAGEVFSESEIPQDIADKRKKQEDRKEKKTAEKESLKEKALTKKTGTKASVKKIDQQLQGISIAEKLINSLVFSGLSSIDTNARQAINIQIKELGNYYISGIQTAFNNLMIELREVEDEEYTKPIDKINYIVALLKKAKAYLNEKKENPEMPLEIGSAIEEQIGTVWKLADLIQLGLWEENAELIQLSFNSYDDQARKEFVDEGSWINLKTGKIYKTKNFKPYRAKKFIKEDDSVFEVLQLKDIYIYPGDINPRVRWENDALTNRAIKKEDIDVIRSYASDNYAELIKYIKNSIKNPLNDKNPLILISLHKAYLNGDHIVVEDKQGNKLTLCDFSDQLISPEANLKMLLPENPEEFCLLATVNNNVQTALFSAEPISLISPDRIIRLLY